MRLDRPSNAITNSLTRQDVFTEEVIETWIDYKMRNEVDAVRQRPHPYEFELYYDI